MNRPTRPVKTEITVQIKRIYKYFRSGLANKRLQCLWTNGGAERRCRPPTITRYIRHISTRYIRCIRLDISDVFIQDIYDTYHYQIYQMYHHQIYQGPKHRCRLYGIDKVRISTQTLAFFHLFLFPTTMHPEMRCFLQNRYVKRKKYFWKMDIIQPSNI